MEKKEIRSEEKKGIMTLENRKRLSLNGVMEVISFNDEKIILKSSLGSLTVKGTDLKMNKLDVQNGDMIIMGSIDGFSYNNELMKPNKENMLKKLFK
ncbi:MAG: sporulation protein YabP [Solirubrobacterales bacterium]